MMMQRLLLEAFRYWWITISLSHKISRRRIEAAPRHRKEVLSMAGIQKFVGSLIYYHRFIDNFATFATSLYELTEEQLRSGRDLKKAKAAYEYLKRRFAEMPLLVHADRRKPYTIILYANY
ncbi:TPA: hypothetical protein N0F65_004137 [Lagenidium giganteum]|uniref:Reverse transcriptase/retrotransposon-derived protein RNase H-like domain-containing protein n=1 Tax=Lagenidium giganteum TaxID=4803 RepID=A0AAV2ZCK7_9STRA|nr:TPA: hypothetical protein N0F65_004137 [Lagenidium giganteum]